MKRNKPPYRCNICKDAYCIFKRGNRIEYRATEYRFILNFCLKSSIITTYD